MKKSLAFLVFNFVGLQITWAACAYGATHEFPRLGLYTGLSYIFLHFFLSKFRLRDFRIMITLGIAGLLIDYTLTKLNIASFPSAQSSNYLIPAWLAALWFVFSLMVPYSLYWLRKNYGIAAIVGAIGGSFSYFLGHKLGALVLSDPIWLSTTIYFAVWGIFLPLAFLVTKHFTQK